MGDGKKYIPYKNISGEIIPAFALISLVDATSGKWPDYQNYDVDGTEFVRRGGKPDAFSTTNQDPACLAVNGPIPVPSGARGSCTQDWPARVLYNGWSVSGDKIGAGYTGERCGPIAGSWYASPHGTAFRTVAQDLVAGESTGSSSSLSGPVAIDGGRVRTIWVAPAHGVALVTALEQGFGWADPLESITVPSAAASPGAGPQLTVEPVSNRYMSFWNFTPDVTSPNGRGVVTSDVGLALPGGIYQGAFQANLTPVVSAPTADYVGLRMYISDGPFLNPSDPAVEVATTHFGQERARKTAPSPYRSHYFISVPFMVNLVAGQSIIIRNYSDMAVSYDSFTFVLNKLTEYRSRRYAYGLGSDL